MDIIGAGIGGLITAIALKRKGIDSTIFEQAESIETRRSRYYSCQECHADLQKLGLEKEIA